PPTRSNWSGPRAGGLAYRGRACLPVRRSRSLNGTGRRAPASPMRIAYAHFGDQSGVTTHVTAALEAVGHEVVPVPAIGPLEPRDAATGRPRITGPVALHLAAALLRYGRRAMSYRWNTGVAFDLHSRWVGEQLARAGPIDAVLQNGALFAPGLPPALP